MKLVIFHVPDFGQEHVHFSDVPGLFLIGAQFWVDALNVPRGQQRGGHVAVRQREESESMNPTREI